MSSTISQPGFEPGVGDPPTRRALLETRRQIVDLTAQIVALQTQGKAFPVGTFIQGGWTAAPDGFLLMDGVTITDGALTYPALATMFPSWVSGDDLIPPNTANRVLMGVAASPGVAAGAMTHTLASANLPLHTHTVDHGHADTLAAPAHTHSMPNASIASVAQTGLSNRFVTATAWATSGTGATGGASATALSGGITSHTGASGNGGFANTAVSHTPAHVTAITAVKY